MRPFLVLALYTASCTAACIWLRDTSDNAGLAWCVDGSTKQEGYFEYKFDEDMSDLTPTQFHKKINRQYAKEAMRGPVLLSPTEPNNQNWTMSNRALLGTVLDGGLRAMSKASDKLSDMVADQIEKVRGYDDESLPYSLCLEKEYNYETGQGYCIRRLDHSMFYMSQEQIKASDRECHTVCNGLRRHCASKLLESELEKGVMERRCCSCPIGHAH